MRAIDGDALMEAMYHRAFETDGDTMWQSGCWVRYRAIEQTVKEQPTITPERKQGRWIPQDHNKKNGMITTTVYYCPTCSVCGKTGGYDMSFCPNCGADMREDET